MLIDLAQVAVGLVVLLLAGDLLVRGAVNLALRLCIPALMVGMTIVAFGTSAPELLVSVKAILQDAGGLALGNVVGSNIANILLVLGLPALVSALAVNREVLRDYLMMLAVSVLFTALALTGVIGGWQGLVLLAAFALFMADSIRRGRESRTQPDALEGADPSMPGARIALYTVIGIIGLPLGANLLVSGAVDIAETLGVSDLMIGLTIVAVGTSLPELATTLMAAIRREGGVALGNIIGSNLFNLALILGVAGQVGDMVIPAQMVQLDLWVMLGASLVLAPFIWTEKPITRIWGGVLLLGYAGYIWALMQIGV
ncbi:calcium/sodium antiporter [Roseinatronobacter alkalisoli]|uniref:Calcium/sodium antiporter n=1 Tax=Roseinatronobacter alkalisoli TaxID=3028235 RepID=A0ABT5T405_9RHOB|nr:calcium/sodium antiporter [Roseinatronobacter sp. HJB301]MDD7969848.1 calcium/sodium antiporter [Roseinatronobacter sp. HJB301]